MKNLLKLLLVLNCIFAFLNVFWFLIVKNPINMLGAAFCLLAVGGAAFCLDKIEEGE